MLLIVLKITLLLGAIVIPLMPQKIKKKTAVKSNSSPNKELSKYAVSENGKLEEKSNCS